MTSPSPPILVDVSSDDDGSVMLAAAPGSYRQRVTREEVEERDRLIAIAEEARVSSPGASFYVRDRDRDETTLRSELLWAALRRWDLEVFIRPLLETVGGSRFVLHPGRSRLRHLSLRGSLLEGVRTGAYDERLLERVHGLAYWDVVGLQRFLEHALVGAVPVVDPLRTTLIIAPPDDGVDQAIAAAPRSRWSRIVQALIPDLRAAEMTLALEEKLLSQAARLGMTVIHEARRVDLLDRVGATSSGATLLLIAHQDRYGVHLSDGPVPMDAIRIACADWIAAGGLSYDTVDLGVCRAEEERNLAEIFQACGTPVVMTRGMTSFYGRDVAHALVVVQRLAEHGPAPLPDLVDRIWLDLTRAARPVPA